MPNFEYMTGYQRLSSHPIPSHSTPSLTLPLKLYLPSPLPLLTSPHRSAFLAKVGKTKLAR